ncbi:mucin-5AC-like [Venturia canescens]|uniref:mucin-5AC-like n=1 Tax=Venturia canescens TaxID=32260 RepID=UPI001C9CAEBC|nr:mucin-5AC-like [Venturia canescens]XP_043276964.1 mucin-5AC-like [Venturia canescens]
MATATMGLRRRVTVNNSPSPTNQQSSASASTSGSTSGTNKRTRTENNNSLSHGNLNSLSTGATGHRDEPPNKKSRAGGMGNSVKTRANSPAVTESALERGNNAHHGSSGRGRNAAGKLSSRTKSPSISTATSAIAATSSTSTPTSSNPTISTASPISIPASISVAQPVQPDISSSFNVLGSNAWPTSAGLQEAQNYTSMSGLNMPGPVPTSLCAAAGLGLPTSIPYMATSMATFVGNATNLGKNSSVSYLDISNMTGGSMNTNSLGNMSASYPCKSNPSAIPVQENNSGSVPLPFSGVVPASSASSGAYGASSTAHMTQQPSNENCSASAKTFQNDAMFNAYQPWVIKTYGDLAKTKTITIKKYARILRTLKGEEVNSAENSKFRFWVKSKGFHIGQPSGYDAKPADRIVGRHAVTSPGLDPPLYVPTQLPHNKALNGAEGTVPPGRVYKKVAIVENFFDIIHAVHVDLEGRPGKHAGQKRTYRTITETYAFLPREAVTRFLLGCTECQRRPRTPSPSNLSNQSQAPISSGSVSVTSTIGVTGTTTTATTRTRTPTPTVPAPSATTTTPLSPTPAATALSASQPRQSSPKPREASHPPESKSLFSYRHQKHQQRNCTAEKPEKDQDAERTEKDKERETKYNPLSITNLLKKEPTVVSTNPFTVNEAIAESRRTPESDRASSRSSASSKRKRMLPEGRTPSPPPSLPLPTPWSPGLDPKNTPIDYSLPITTAYLKHQQRILAEKNKAMEAASFEEEREREARESSPIDVGYDGEDYASYERDRFSPAAGLIDTNLNLLATIQHLHCQVMLALTERLRPSVIPTSLMLPPATGILPNILMGSEFAISSSMAQRYS